MTKPVIADDFAWVPPHFLSWQAYDPAVKSDLTSTAVRIAGAWLLFDPIALRPLLPAGEIAGVVLTNANHARGAADFEAPLFGPDLLAQELATLTPLADTMEIFGLTAHAIAGGAPGEFAFYDARAGGSWIIGDALIHLIGFDFLPRKYCSEQKLMIRSLRKLLDSPFERLFFAHGPPIVARAREHLLSLFEQ
ncbi:MAG: hypothetical protein M3R59_03745 [Verrucomicrobiota bacterium]|nr:hypothetical protein [Verrucomicrobiota bacterium]